MYNDIQKMLNDYFWKLLGNISLKWIGIKIHPNFPIWTMFQDNKIVVAEKFSLKNSN